jgi:hypothetical protein
MVQRVIPAVIILTSALILVTNSKGPKDLGPTRLIKVEFGCKNLS